MHTEKKAKNNPKVNGQRIIATAALLAVLTSAGLGVKAMIEHSKKDEVPTVEPTIDAMTSSAHVLRVSETFKAIESQYELYQKDDPNSLSTAGLIFQFYEHYLNGGDYSEREKLQIIYNLTRDEGLYDSILKYIEENSAAPTRFQIVNINENNLEIIKNDETLIGEISEAADAYRVPAPILAGLIAKNANGKEISYDTLYSSFDGTWNKLPSDRSVYNFTTEEDDKLKEWVGKENKVMHLSAILANSIKEQNYDLKSAIPLVVMGIERGKSAKSDEVNNIDNEILTYATFYENDRRFVVHYLTGNKNNVYTITYISSDYEEYVLETLNSIVAQIQLNILSQYDNILSH